MSEFFNGKLDNITVKSGRITRMKAKNLMKSLPKSQGKKIKNNVWYNYKATYVDGVLVEAKIRKVRSDKGKKR